MIKIAILIIAFSIQAVTLSPYIEYNNTSQSKFMNQNPSIGINIKTALAQVRVGIEYLELNNYGTIHKPINGHIITNQTDWACPIGLEAAWQWQNKIRVKVGLGAKFYFAQTISSNDIETIESKKANNGEALISNYKESFEPNAFARVEFGYEVIPKLVISFSKTWQQMKNHIRYTYLNQYAVSTINEFSYDPISLSIQYHF
ncbi:MAG: hypothetical protein VW397_05035 [Candidatus Margulisiibacteriota bacterium]